MCPKASSTSRPGHSAGPVSSSDPTTRIPTEGWLTLWCSLSLVEFCFFLPIGAALAYRQAGAGLASLAVTMTGAFIIHACLALLAATRGYAESRTSHPSIRNAWQPLYYSQTRYLLVVNAAFFFVVIPAFIAERSGQPKTADDNRAVLLAGIALIGVGFLSDLFGESRQRVQILWRRSQPPAKRMFYRWFLSGLAFMVTVFTYALWAYPTEDPPKPTSTWTGTCTPTTGTTTMTCAGTVGTATATSSTTPQPSPTSTTASPTARISISPTRTTTASPAAQPTP